jgi:hypothetical protein
MRIGRFFMTFDRTLQTCKNKTHIYSDTEMLHPYKG